METIILDTVNDGKGFEYTVSIHRAQYGPTTAKRVWRNTAKGTEGIEYRAPTMAMPRAPRAAWLFT